MRGIPGGGKSTEARRLMIQHLAKKCKSMALYSTDDFHMEEDEYVFKPDRLGEFHVKNQERAAKAMELGIELVIVDNTNIKRRDMKPYVDAGREFNYDIEEVVVGKDRLCPPLDEACPHKFADYIDMCAARNTHGVPREAIERMARSFQE